MDSFVVGLQRITIWSVSMPNYNKKWRMLHRFYSETNPTISLEGELTSDVGSTSICSKGFKGFTSILKIRARHADGNYEHFTSHTLPLYIYALNRVESCIMDID